MERDPFGDFAANLSAAMASNPAIASDLRKLVAAHQELQTFRTLFGQTQLTEASSIDPQAA
jgi:hypothetical protein